jgi:gonadotropin-releasing hormone receptor
MQEDPWLCNQKNKSCNSGVSTSVNFHEDPNAPWWNTKDDGGGVEAHSLEETGDNVRVVVAVYCVLFSVAAIGNLSVFITLLRARHRRSRISLLMSHLAAADLIVTFVMIPLEVAWRVTTKWLAGNFACKLFLFLRAFGLYLSSNILVCISLDRYFAIIYPLKLSDARRRGKLMLLFAWLNSLMCAYPQVRNSIVALRQSLTFQSRNTSQLHELEKLKLHVHSFPLLKHIKFIYVFTRTTHLSSIKYIWPPTNHSVLTYYMQLNTTRDATRC